MKRTIISLLFCAVMLLSAACGKGAVFPVPVSPEPETEVVMPDQAGVSVPTPASVGGWNTNSRLLSEMDPAPSEKIESPSHVADEFAYEKLKIIWDADVTVPEIGAYAVMRVQKRELSKDELLSVIEGLTGTTNDIYTSWTMNRSEVQAMLEEAAPYEGTERLPKEYLKNLKNLLKNAPERNENILADQNKLVTYSSLYVPVSGGTAAQFVLSDGFLYYVRDIHMEAYPQWDMMLTSLLLKQSRKRTPQNLQTSSQFFLTSYTKAEYAVLLSSTKQAMLKRQKLLLSTATPKPVNGNSLRHRRSNNNNIV